MDIEHLEDGEFDAESDVEDRDIQAVDPGTNVDMARLFFHPDKKVPCKFWIVRDINQERRLEIQAQITNHGGTVVSGKLYSEAFPDIDVVVVTQREQFSRESARFDMTPRTYVIFARKLDHYVQERRFYFPVLEFENMGGRLPRSMREGFTAEDEEHLCRFLAMRIPYPAEGGRTGLRVYSQMWANHFEFPWARRHPPESWRGYYKNNRHRLDPKIDDYVRINPPQPNGKGRYDLRRVPFKRSRIPVPLDMPDAREEEEEEEQEEQEQEDEDIPVSRDEQPPPKRRRTDGHQQVRMRQHRAGRHSEPVPARRYRTQEVDDDDVDQPAYLAEFEFVDPGPSSSRRRQSLEDRPQPPATGTTAQGRPTATQASAAPSSQATLVASQAPSLVQKSQPGPRPTRPRSFRARLTSSVSTPPPNTGPASSLPSMVPPPSPPKKHGPFVHLPPQAHLLPPPPPPPSAPSVHALSATPQSMSNGADGSPRRSPSMLSSTRQRSRASQGQTTFGQPVKDHPAKPLLSDTAPASPYDGPYRNTRARSRSASVEPASAPGPKPGKGKGKMRTSMQAPIIEESEELVENDKAAGQLSESSDSLEVAEALYAVSAQTQGPLSPDDAQTNRRLSAAFAARNDASPLDESEPESDDQEKALNTEFERHSTVMPDYETTSEETFPARGTRARQLKNEVDAREIFPPIGTRARQAVAGQRLNNPRRV
ncbi:hypothetical protein K488DRAFT_89803 [Vararia minispora EC-137]|uniref:Uncharacterized protein n=1 Tax=Vararia minispora EC-137 TaxID=1314806 RepID=A0ACB8Q9A9_9AGAM|nr:hypothetical protein K488DRAFT_89803 [Vararia minispora EC-137]